MNSKRCHILLSLMAGGVLVLAGPDLVAAPSGWSPQQQGKVATRSVPGAASGKEVGPRASSGVEVRFFERGYLGVQLLDLSPELQAHFGADKSQGVLVARVEADSPAAEAGLLVGDLLLAVDGQPVGSSWEVARRIGGKEEGHKAELKLLRSGAARTLIASIRQRKKPQLEMSRFFMRWPGGEFSYPGPWGSESLESALEQFNKQFNKKSGPGKTGSMFQFFHKEKQMERRLQEMEEKLRKLEKKLQR